MLDLMLRCDVHAYGEPDSDLEDLLFDWGQIDLEHSAWLAFDPQNELVGYSAILPWGQDLRYDFYVQPEQEGLELIRVLLGLCEARGKTLAQARPAAELYARTFVPHVGQAALQAVKQAGFQAGRYYFQMQADLEAPRPAPVWPPGITLRTAVPGQDDRPVYELVQAAFALPGRTPQPFADWRAFMQREDSFDPDLWFLAVAGGQIAGVCLCLEYETTGWVRQLAVAERMRRQGVGTALLLQACQAFKRRGYRKVGLTVESRRPDAYRFYQVAGMRQARQFDEYFKRLV